LVERLDNNDIAGMREELGDVLFQVLLHSQLASEKGRFTLQDVVNDLDAKLIRRHPHVFGDKILRSVDEVRQNWEEIKRAEKLQKSQTAAKGKSRRVPRSLEPQYPPGLPALMAAQKIGEKTRKEKFDWDSVAGVWTKVREELGEFEEALKSKRKKDIAHELGDIIFSLAQVARHLHLDCEQLTRETNERFRRRYTLMKDLMAAQGLELRQLSAKEKEKYWQLAKKRERKGRPRAR
jgi:tetrapyrrole methylase family protein/MazG family protein